MDELERRVRDGLAGAVDGWEPTPSEARRVAPAASRRRPVAFALAGVAVLVLVLGGIGVALGAGGSRGGSGAGAATLAAAPATPTEAATDSPSPSCAPLQFLSEKQYLNALAAEPDPAECPGAPTCIPAPGGSAAYSSTLCFSPGAPGGRPTAATPASSRTPASPAPATSSPAPATTSGAAACTSADLRLTVTTDATTYAQGQLMHIHVASAATGSCEAAGVSVVVEPRDSTVAVWSTCSYRQLAPGTVCGASRPVERLHPGSSDAHDYTWDFHAPGARGSDPTGYAGIGGYRVVYTLGQVQASDPIQVTGAPACTPAQLRVALSADTMTYSSGETARLSGTVTNTSSTACTATQSIGDPVAKDSAGATVWTACQGSEEGLTSDGECATAAVGYGPTIIPAGATVVGADAGGSGTHVFTWDLTRTGSTSTDPKPVPDGSYTVSWDGLSGAGLTPATVQVIVTG